MTDLIGQILTGVLLLILVCCLLKATNDPAMEELGYAECTHMFMSETGCLAESSEDCMIQMAARCGFNPEEN